MCTATVGAYGLVYLLLRGFGGFVSLYTDSGALTVLLSTDTPSTANRLPSRSFSKEWLPDCTERTSLLGTPRLPLKFRFNSKSWLNSAWYWSRSGSGTRSVPPAPAPAPVCARTFCCRISSRAPILFMSIRRSPFNVSISCLEADFCTPALAVECCPPTEKEAAILLKLSGASTPRGASEPCGDPWACDPSSGTSACTSLPSCPNSSALLRPDKRISCS